MTNLNDSAERVHRFNQLCREGFEVRRRHKLFFDNLRALMNGSQEEREIKRETS